jgi:hypothetical protein
MGSYTRMHFDFHHTEFILTFAISIVYVGVMMKTATTIPSWYGVVIQPAYALSQ